MFGKVKRVVTEKGFGFIIGEDGSEFFFHRSAVERPNHFEEVCEGDEVSFEEGNGPKGPRAEKVRLV